MLPALLKAYRLQQKAAHVGFDWEKVSQVMDKVEHTAALKEAFRGLGGRERDDVGVRLMILGSENDDIEFVEMVESCGSTVVTDDHCTGTRYFWNNVQPGEDRLASIADRFPLSAFIARAEVADACLNAGFPPLDL